MSAESGVPQGQRVLQDAHKLSPERRVDLEDRDDRRPEKTYFEDVVKMAGFGRKPERCQSFRPVGFCRENGHPVLGQSSCGTRGCPDHWGDWLEKTVIDGLARLAAYRHTQEGAGKRMLHVVASPDQDRHWSVDSVWRVRSDSYDVIEAVGGRGGCTVTHPYRTSERGDLLFETAVESGDWEEGSGKWKLLRDTAGDWEEMQAYTDPAPHYHGLVAARDFDPEEIPERWVVKNIRSFERFHYRDVESYRDMASTLWYLSTHAGHQAGRQSRTWFGDLHPASFDPEEELTAAEWRIIQDKAEKAVNTKPGGVPVEDGVQGMECPEDGCESAVIGIERLGEFARDEEWMESLEPRERARIRGLRLWIVEDADRPPPGRRESKEALTRWLEHRGGQAARSALGSRSGASGMRQGRFSG